MKQFLSTKWIPYEEIGDYLIKDRETKLTDKKFNSFILYVIFFLVGVIFGTIIQYTLTIY